MDIYISTPVTSRPEGTLHAKMKAANHRVWELEEQHTLSETISPFMLKYRSFETETKAEMTDAQAMGACIKALMECDVMLLDDAEGWLNSKGVAAELAVARIYGIEVIKASELPKPKEDEK